MAKGLFGGQTDYSHQSLKDIIADLIEEYKHITLDIEQIEERLSIVKENGYWNENIDPDFRSVVEYSLIHYRTTKEELFQITQELAKEVREDHCKRLKRMATVADEINVKIGRVWHNRDFYKDYDNENFRLVERAYADTRDTAVNLLDIENIQIRLNDFVGWKQIISTVSIEKQQTDKTPVDSENDFTRSTIEDHLEEHRKIFVNDQDYLGSIDLLFSYFNNENPNPIKAYKIIGRNKKKLAFTLGQMHKSITNAGMNAEYLEFSKRVFSPFSDEEIDKNDLTNSRMYKYFVTKP